MAAALRGGGGETSRQTATSPSLHVGLRTGRATRDDRSTTSSSVYSKAIVVVCGDDDGGPSPKPIGADRWVQSRIWGKEERMDGWQTAARWPWDGCRLRWLEKTREKNSHEEVMIWTVFKDYQCLSITGAKNSSRTR
ncbi:hypothetical protein L596_029945 [Steinernema carpocapsae]|uniref:Uncharacterized protein n=1 Tax=Steinernema carpocapsae TaxID=34508 RepID=A0A4U5LR94_STECR|nr:hypothetical protein L596_029945 [Steinernema carpocapsae]